MVREEIVFGDDEYLCMRAYVEHRGVDTQQVQDQIGATKCKKGSACPWQPRPQEGYFAIQRAEVASDSQTRISEPDRRTNEQGVDYADEDDIDSDATLIE
jgi:hypothetical protein